MDEHVGGGGGVELARQRFAAFPNYTMVLSYTYTRSGSVRCWYSPESNLARRVP